jgi:hypothetical protein
MKRRDDVELQLRVGLNSGQVIAGEIGAGTLGYTAIGEQVGMAQRMESVAPPGGVMLSESTARLVENAAVLGDAEMVCITGSDKAVPTPPRGRVGLAGSSPSLGDESRWAPVGIGHVDGCTGARDRRSGVCRWCHRTCRNRQEPPRWRVGDDRRKPRCRRIFGVLRIPHQRGPISRRDDAVSGGDSDRGSGWRAARAKVRTKLPEADAQDLLLFDDLLGIADPTVPPPLVDPDGRRRRLTSQINAALLARDTPAVYVIEDAHWIDKVSESMLADVPAVIPKTHAPVLVTYRPE